MNPLGRYASYHDLARLECGRLLRKSSVARGRLVNHWTSPRAFKAKHRHPADQAVKIQNGHGFEKGTDGGEAAAALLFGGVAAVSPAGRMAGSVEDRRRRLARPLAEMAVRR
jgi:hypothetical protein